MNETTFWKLKLAARLHDPAEKALVLLRDPAGHEGGSIVGVARPLGFETEIPSRAGGSQVEKIVLPEDMKAIVQKADKWAAAADRAQFPRDRDDRFQSWAQVDFAENGEIIHPLAGEIYRVPQIGRQILVEHIKAASESMFQDLIRKDKAGNPDYFRTALAFWRFGPELGRQLKGIGHLWSLLPADTRTPDHTIWHHLDLCSAFAGAMAKGGRPALLLVSLGPVQPFIAAARSTSDLWAGSHFLSTLAWQALRVVVEELGPDVVIYPQLRGVPIVDVWLLHKGLEPKLFGDPPWKESSTDYNPLFTAALPNKFVAVVPAGQGEVLARRIEAETREWVLREARAMLDRLLAIIGETPAQQHCYRQLEEQLSGFPEVHWSVSEWSEDEKDLPDRLAPFYPEDGNEPGFFGSPAWDVLSHKVKPAQEWEFWSPNPGIWYAPVYDLGERLLAAAKSVRPFQALPQKGYRDSLTGEYEWLTLNEEQLEEGSPRTRTDTLWARVAQNAPRLAKKGEHLSAYGLIKRVWPEHFPQSLREEFRSLGITVNLKRYVISTYVMAMAPSLRRFIQEGPAYQREDDPEASKKARRAWESLREETGKLERLALPRGLMSFKMRQSEWWETAVLIPSLLEEIEEEAEEGDNEWVEARLTEVRDKIETALGIPVETYYGLLLMDGDRLGAWLDGAKSLSFEQSYHSKVRNYLKGIRDEQLRAFLALRRPPSPGLHMAISSSLNSFAVDLVRYVLEECYLGKVLYAGGDDVQAMTAAGDLLDAATLLRAVYSGEPPAGITIEKSHGLKIDRGFVEWEKKRALYRVMGPKATASCGAVIAHHQAPLAAVLRELRRAERRAKSEGCRDALSLSIVKRSGGLIRLTMKWGKPVSVLQRTREFLADPDVSRRAVYNTVLWLQDLPEPAGDFSMLESLLQYQFARQARTKPAKQRARELSSELVRLAEEWDKNPLGRLRDFLSAADFLAREVRSGGRHESD
jgi:CRISPR-associated protein Cmr2